jgi:glyoxylase I family protein
MPAGQCLCGAVRYEVTAPLGEARLCHCEMCRRANGAAFSANVRVARKDYSLVAGEASITEYESSPGHFRAFCRVCGSPVYARLQVDPEHIRLRLGGLSGELDVRVTAHVWVSANPSWYAIEDSLEQHTEAFVAGQRPAKDRPDDGAAPEVIGIDHIYLSVTDPERSEQYYDRVLLEVLGFRKNRFDVAGDPHVQYFNRHFGIVLRPARGSVDHDPYSPGLHHLCLRVETAAEVEAVAERLRALSIEATPARLYPEYAPDYVATFFEDPDGVRLEVTNYRAERRERHDCWDVSAETSPANRANRRAP